MKRPLLPVALFYVGGISIGNLIPVKLHYLLLVSLGLALATFVWKRIRHFALSLLIFIAGWTNLAYHSAQISPYDLRAILGDNPHLVSARGKLVETPSLRVYMQNEQDKWRTVAQIELSAISTNQDSWMLAKGVMAVSTPGALTNYFAGQMVEIRGVAALPKEPTAPGTFNYREYLKQLGIYYVLQTRLPADWSNIGTFRAPPLADRFRAWAQKALSKGIPAEDEALRLQWALTLGWKTALTEEVSEPFVRAATYHIFAVDGLRMAIVFGIFFGVFRAVGLPRFTCGLLLLPLIWFYVDLTGWPASAIRSTVMLTIVTLGWLLRRPSDLLNSLFAAALVILIWEPHQLFQAGFQLSFFVVLSMILMLPHIRGVLLESTSPHPYLPQVLYPAWRKTFQAPIRHAIDLLATSFAAWVGSIPLVACYFNIVTPVSTFANLLAVPLCALVLVSNLTSLLFALWLPIISELLNNTGWFLMQCICRSSEWFAAWPQPLSYFYVEAPSTYSTALYYAILVAITTGWLFRPEFRSWKVALTSVTVMIWCGVTW